MPQKLLKFRRKRLFSLLFLCSFVLCLWLSYIPSPLNFWRSGNPAYAQSSPPENLVQRGLEAYQTGDLKDAIALWQSALKRYQTAGDRDKSIVVIENLARTHQQIGQVDQAMEEWQQAITHYRDKRDLLKVGRLLTEQAQAYSKLGQYRQAATLLCHAKPGQNDCVADSALGLARTQQDPLGETAALASLGDILRLRGEYQQSIHFWQQSLEMARQVGHSTFEINVLNGLGKTHSSLAKVSYRQANTARQIGDIDEAKALQTKGKAQEKKALASFQDSLAIAQQNQDNIGQLRALLQIIPLYQQEQSTPRATRAYQEAQGLLDTLPNSRDKVYRLIELANLYPHLTVENDKANRSPVCLHPAQQAKAQPLLQQAVEIAQSIGDRRAESFALGELGHLFECQHNYKLALKTTRKARWAAEQDFQAKDSLYLWEWQTGRLLHAQGRELDAIAAYETGIQSLEEIRSDILIANRDQQFDFRDAVEPIYRELIALRLQRNSILPASGSTDAQKENINTVLNTFDSLALAELQNYFGEDCVIAALPNRQANVVDVDQTSAIISTIILPERLAVILNLPNGQQKLNWVNVDRDTLTKTVNQYRRDLEGFFDIYNPKLAQQLYDWLVRPFEPDLAQFDIQALVFVQDGILRSVPMAALHDGQGFLIQKYAAVTTPSLALTDPKPIDRKNLNLLAFGLTESSTIEGEDFPALAYVDQELQAIKDLLPKSQLVLNEEFTRDRIQKILSKTIYPVIHIATHAEFGSEPDKTFLVTGNNQKLTLNEFDTLIRSISRSTDPIELLTLTACKTAVGDDRAALGLAGVALQAGSKSAVASLWAIDDAATAQVSNQFYSELLKPNITKAEALQTAQLDLLNAGGPSAHPAFWAPYILIGNWL